MRVIQEPVHMSETVTKSLRIPEQTIREMEQEFEDRDFSSAANELLAEGLKMRRCPGIVFATSGSGKRAARVAGTGNYVWLIIGAYKNVHEDLSRLRKVYPQLSEEQLRAALNYYRCYPDEIDARIQANEAITPEVLYKRYPFMQPAHAEVLSRRGSKSHNRRNPPKKRARRR